MRARITEKGDKLASGNFFKYPASGGKFEDAPGLVSRPSKIDVEFSPRSQHDLHRHVGIDETMPTLLSDPKSDMSTKRNVEELSRIHI